MEWFVDTPSTSKILDTSKLDDLLSRVEALEASSGTAPAARPFAPAPKVLAPEVLKPSVPGDSGGQGTEEVPNTGDTVTEPDSEPVGSVTDDGVAIVQPTGDPMDAPAPVAAPSDESATVDEATAAAV